MKRSFLFILSCLVMLSGALSAGGQDTVQVLCSKPILLSAHDKMYYLTRSDSSSCDSIALISNEAYFKLVNDKQSCKTFIDLYRMYKGKVTEGDTEMTGLIASYEGIIKTKDDAYNRLHQEYYTLNSLLNASITQTEAAVSVSRSSLDSLSHSLAYISNQNKYLSADLDAMKKGNTKNKLRFGLGGMAIGILLGIIIAM